MNAVRFRALIALVAMIVALGGAYRLTPRIHLSDMRPSMDLEQVFPRAFAGWVIDDRTPVQLVSPDQKRLLDKIYQQTLSRTYVNASGDRIMLSVAYGGDQSDASRAHRPEVCYPAQGFEILASSEHTLEAGTGGLRVRQLIARQGGRVEPISYWLVIGDEAAITGTEQRMRQLDYGLRGVIPDGILVRVSTVGIDPASRAYGIHQDFIAGLYKAIPKAFSLRIFGQAVVS
jgi:EpsI family protein